VVECERACLSSWFLCRQDVQRYGLVSAKTKSPICNKNLMIVYYFQSSSCILSWGALFVGSALELNSSLSNGTPPPLPAS